MTTWIPHSKPTLEPADYRAVEEILRSAQIAEGPLVGALEAAVAAYLGLAGGVATSSGTAALVCALKALGLETGDEVILPSYCCEAVWHAVRAAGATPVLCDVAADWCLCVDSVVPRLTSRTRAVIVVHAFGIVADVGPICELGLPVIEDCCQALGASVGGRTAGSWGSACVLSFHATKLLTSAEGGMVLSRDPATVERQRHVARGDLHAGFGRQPLSDLQAALALSQLARFGSFLERRRSAARRYLAELDDLGIELPSSFEGRSVFFRFPIRTDMAFDEAQAGFARDHIHVRRGVDALLHRRLGLSDQTFPGAERCFAKTLSLPIYPSLTADEQDRVVESARRVFTRVARSA